MDEPATRSLPLAAVTFLPIVDRELRINARRRGLHLMRVLVAFTLMVIWVVLALATGPAGRPVAHARAAFSALTVVGLGFTIFAGIFLTADCLSEERREGTLGLLFLTDLKGYDVVLGKLASTSLRAFYGLLAGMPLLALPLLMGGTTPGEFWRMSLILCVTLFLSLSVGMGVSAFSRGAREAMGRTFLAILVLVGILPMLWQLSRLLPPAFRMISTGWLLWPSPAHAYRCALDACYSSYHGARDFWISISAMAGLGATCLVGAMVLLPSVWQEKVRWGQVETVQSRSRVARFGSKQFRAARRWLLDTNPFYWLATRDRWMGRWTMLVLLVLLLIWLGFFCSAFSSRMSVKQMGFIVAMYMAYGLHQFLKCSIAVEASRRISEDRQSGVLELLLVTPLHPKQMVAAQLKAIWHAFAPSVFALVMVNTAMIWLLLGPNPLRMRGNDVPTFLAIFVGGIVLLLADMYALVRVAIWKAFTSRRHSRAILATLGRVIFPPWAAILFFIFLGWSGSIRGQNTAETLIYFWLIGSAIFTWFSAVWAAQNLNREFRNVAAPGYGHGTTTQETPSVSTLPSRPA